MDQSQTKIDPKRIENRTCDVLEGGVSIATKAPVNGLDQDGKAAHHTTVLKDVAVESVDDCLRCQHPVLVAYDLSEHRGEGGALTLRALLKGDLLAVGVYTVVC